MSFIFFAYSYSTTYSYRIFLFLCSYVGGVSEGRSALTSYIYSSTPSPEKILRPAKNTVCRPLRRRWKNPDYERARACRVIFRTCRAAVRVNPATLNAFYRVFHFSGLYKYIYIYTRLSFFFFTFYFILLFAENFADASLQTRRRRLSPLPVRRPPNTPCVSSAPPPPPPSIYYPVLGPDAPTAAVTCPSPTPVVCAAPSATKVGPKPPHRPPGRPANTGRRPVARIFREKPRPGRVFPPGNVYFHTVSTNVTKPIGGVPRPFFRGEIYSHALIASRARIVYGSYL